MISQIKIIKADSLDPYRNLAVEHLLTENAKAGELTLFLWQNERTVVIGRNQNAWAEVNTERLQTEGGRLARRFSGGGAVYHDSGNLNFSFCVRREDYNVERQLEVVLRAVRSLGIPAQMTGRNDLTVGGRKFSGNAFVKTDKGCCHHGTLMLSVDPDALSRYLNVSREKLSSKGVASVRSRVINLREIVPQLSIEELSDAMVKALEEVTELTAEVVEVPEIPAELYQKLSSWEWLYGRRIPFTIARQKRFAWGGVEVYLTVNEGRVQDAQVFTDALDEHLASRIEAAVTGVPFRRKDLEEACDFNDELSLWAGEWTE